MICLIFSIKNRASEITSNIVNFILIQNIKNVKSYTNVNFKLIVQWVKS